MANSDLLIALHSIEKLSDHKDVHYLLEHIRSQIDPTSIGRMHGIRGGFLAYGQDRDDLTTIKGIINRLEKDEQRILETVLRMLLRAYDPLIGDSQGTVTLKTIKREYVVLNEDGLPTQNEDGTFVTDTYFYTYCYIRILTIRGDKKRNRMKQVSCYADRGAGRGTGGGGVVAHALDTGYITEEEILNAWHAEREPDELPPLKISKYYAQFIEQCAILSGANRDTQVSG